MKRSLGPFLNGPILNTESFDFIKVLRVIGDDRVIER